MDRHSNRQSLGPFWVIIPVVLGFRIQSAAAELNQCNGVWTNKPCVGARGESIAEKERTPRTQSEIELDGKRLLIHDLEIRATSARKDFNVEVGLLAERTLCLTSESTVAECEAAINIKRKEIEERTLAAATLKATQQRSLGTGVKDGTHSVGNPTVVTILQESNRYDEYKDRRDVKRHEVNRSDKLEQSAQSPGSSRSVPKVSPPSAVDTIETTPK